MIFNISFDWFTNKDIYSHVIGTWLISRCFLLYLYILSQFIIFIYLSFNLFYSWRITLSSELTLLVLHNQNRTTFFLRVPVLISKNKKKSYIRVYEYTAFWINKNKMTKYFMPLKTNCLKIISRYLLYSTLMLQQNLFHDVIFLPLSSIYSKPDGLGLKRRFLFALSINKVTRI